jgi:hypothetical protein
MTPEVKKDSGVYMTYLGRELGRKVRDVAEREDRKCSSVIRGIVREHFARLDEAAQAAVHG